MTQHNEHLGGEDAAWLHMDEATNPMVVTSMLQLARRLPFPDARAVIERIAKLPRFSSRIVEQQVHLGPPRLEAIPDFNATEHIEHVELDSPSEGALRAFVSKAVSTGLDPTRPLWRVILIDRPGAGTTLLCRVHHAIGDGFALLDVLLSLCDQASALREGYAPSSGRGRHASTNRRQNEHLLLDSARALVRLVMLPADPATTLRAPLRTEKRVAWSSPLLLADVKAVAKSLSATINDVIVALVSGALTRHLGRRGEVTPGLEVHAMVPVNLRLGTRPTLDNRFGLVILGLPIGIEDPRARVLAVKQRMKLLRRSREPIVTHALLSAMGWAPRSVEDRAAAFFGKKASVVLTNVPGPQRQLSLCGIPITHMMFWVPEAARIGLGVSVFSYAGEISVGILADTAVVSDPAQLIDDLHAEWVALEQALRAEVASRVTSEKEATRSSAPSARR